MSLDAQPLTPHPFAEPVAIRYTGDSGYLGDGANWLVTHEPVYVAIASRERRTAWLAAVAVYAVVATGGVLYATSASIGVEYQRFAGLLAVVLPVLLAMVVGTRRDEWRKMARRMAHEAGVAHDPTIWPTISVAYAATTEGFRREEEDHIHIDRWSSFEDAVEAGSAIILLGLPTSVIVPRAGFTDQAAADRFVEQVRNVLLREGLDRGTRVRELLASAVPYGSPNARWQCWQCHYELSANGFEGVALPACPECGVGLREMTMESGASLRRPAWRWLLHHLSPRQHV